MALRFDIDRLGAVPATLVGLSAVLLWSTFMGTLRHVAECLGPTLGPACCYTAASAFLVLVQGWPKLSRFPRRWLVAGLVLFPAYEFSFALALGFARNGRQAIEIAMLNYLWPAFTILFAVLFLRRRAGFLLVPGLAAAMAGVCLVVAGDGGLDAAAMLANMADNPAGYAIGLAVALVWATYCTAAVRLSGGETSVTPFLFATTAALWFFHLLFPAEGAVPGFTPSTLAFVCLSALPIGWGYTAWNIGIIRGSVTVLAVASYFIPVFSSFFASVLLDAALGARFWQGTGLVCLGSLLCWAATRQGR